MIHPKITVIKDVPTVNKVPSKNHDRYGIIDDISTLTFAKNIFLPPHNSKKKSPDKCQETKIPRYHSS